MKLTMLLRIRFLPPGYANPGTVEVVLAQVGEARTVEVFWEKPSIIMKANTENFRRCEFLSGYNHVAVCCLLQSPELSLAALLVSPPAFGAIANYGNYLVVVGRLTTAYYTQIRSSRFRFWLRVLIATRVYLNSCALAIATTSA
jgi:hypothetical protein